MQENLCQHSSANEEFTLAQQDSVLTMRLTASLSVSCSITKDADLSWEDFTTSKAVFIPQLTLAQWPQQYMIMMANLFYSMEIHPMVITSHSKAILLCYSCLLTVP